MAPRPVVVLAIAMAAPLGCQLLATLEPAAQDSRVLDDASAFDADAAFAPVSDTPGCRSAPSPSAWPELVYCNDFDEAFDKPVDGAAPEPWFGFQPRIGNDPGTFALDPVASSLPRSLRFAMGVGPDQLRLLVRPIARSPIGLWASFRFRYGAPTSTMTNFDSDVAFFSLELGDTQNSVVLGVYHGEVSVGLLRGPTQTAFAALPQDAIGLGKALRPIGRFETLELSIDEGGPCEADGGIAAWRARVYIAGTLVACKALPAELLVQPMTTTMVVLGGMTQTPSGQEWRYDDLVIRARDVRNVSDAGAVTD